MHCVSSPSSRFFCILLHTHRAACPRQLLAAAASRSSSSPPGCPSTERLLRWPLPRRVPLQVGLHRVATRPWGTRKVTAARSAAGGFPLVPLCARCPLLLSKAQLLLAAPTSLAHQAPAPAASSTCPSAPRRAPAAGLGRSAHAGPSPDSTEEAALLAKPAAERVSFRGVPFVHS